MDNNIFMGVVLSITISFLKLNTTKNKRYPEMAILEMMELLKIIIAKKFLNFCKKIKLLFTTKKVHPNTFLNSKPKIILLPKMSMLPPTRLKKS
jgi:glucose-6-phosphate-specific signal transduction histidine kinase